jgi:hypothetical protein
LTYSDCVIRKDANAAQICGRNAYARTRPRVRFGLAGPLSPNAVEAYLLANDGNTKVIFFSLSSLINVWPLLRSKKCVPTVGEGAEAYVHVINFLIRI